MAAKKLYKTIGVNIIAWIVSIILITPLVLILINSLKTSQAAAEMNLALPDSIQLENFAKVI
jgi:raffinose/stachyose/melibiose transport system permease protein